MIDDVLGAIKGVMVWRKYFAKCNIEESNFFLMMPGEENLLPIILKYLYSYLAEKRGVNAIIISSDSESVEQVNSASMVNVSAQLVQRQELGNILRAYWYKALPDRLLIVSIKELYGRNISHLIGKNNISVDDLVAAGLFALNPIGKLERNERRTSWAFRVRT